MSRAEAVIQQTAALSTQLATVQAIGLAGSHVDGQPDALSDVDVCVYVADAIPAFEARRAAYAALGLTEFIYQDVDFEFSCGDGLRVQGLRCDFNWMSGPVILDFLTRLAVDHACLEYIPGGTLRVKPLADPQGMIAALQAAVPPYPPARAQQRVQNALQSAHRMLYDLGWLAKAVHRQDRFLFLKYVVALLDQMITALFALNRTWLADEKRLVARVAALPLVPTDIGVRLDAIMGAAAELALRTAEIHRLCGEIADLAHAEFPDCAVPPQWPLP